MNLPNIQAKLYENSKKKIKQYPCHANRASAIGHDCERYLFYMRTAWDQAQGHDIALQRIFDEGNQHEKAVLAELADAGVDVIEQQTALYDPQYQLSGHVDGVLNVDGKAVPLEIKSMSGHIFDGIFKAGAGMYEWQAVADSFTTKPWLKKYNAQLQVYMLGKNHDMAILLCKNKNTGAIAQVNVSLDYDYAESLLLKCERINKAVKDNRPPDRIKFDNDTCRNCEYNHLCCPDEVAKDPYQCIDDDQLAEWCNIDLKYEEAAKERARARKELLAWCKANKNGKGINTVVNGKYDISYNGKTMKLVEM